MWASTVTLPWPSASPTSSAIPIEWAQVKGGLVAISGAWSNSHLGLMVNIGYGLNKLNDWQGGYTGVSIPSASGNVVYQCPPAWFYVAGSDRGQQGQVCLWSHDGTGTNVAQGNARYVTLQLKG